MHPRKKTIKELEKNGFIFKRHGASHDLYFQPNTKQTIPVKRHDFNEDDFVDEDAVNEDVETEDDVDLGEGDDLLKDEVEDL